jgi:hypothetical protein
MHTDWNVDSVQQQAIVARIAVGVCRPSDVSEATARCTVERSLYSTERMARWRRGRVSPVSQIATRSDDVIDPENVSDGVCDRYQSAGQQHDMVACGYVRTQSADTSRTETSTHLVIDEGTGLGDHELLIEPV